MQRTAGFTLVELSIVLVVIGLIIGGILVGEDLINAARIRRVVTQIREVNTAIETFRLKFNDLPGDMTNASSILSPDAINGDGNTVLNDVNSYEIENLWHHLSLAGFIGGPFQPVTSLLNINNYASQNRTGAITAYEIALPGFYINVLHSGNYARFFTTHTAAPAENALTITGFPVGVPDSNFLSLYGGIYPGPFNVGLYPKDAFSIDDKIDDGLPLSGSFVVIDPTGLADAMGCSGLAGANVYDFANTSWGACGMWMRLQ